jgi:hypothetical protein
VGIRSPSAFDPADGFGANYLCAILRLVSLRKPRQRGEIPFLYFSRKSAPDVIPGSAHFPKLRKVPSP